MAAMMLSKGTNVNVVLRCRPLLPDERAQASIVNDFLNSNSLLISKLMLEHRARCQQSRVGFERTRSWCNRWRAGHGRRRRRPSTEPWQLLRLSDGMGQPPRQRSQELDAKLHNRRRFRALRCVACCAVSRLPLRRIVSTGRPRRGCFRASHQRAPAVGPDPRAL